VCQQFGQPNTDSRHLPYGDASFDAIVFDPPYMHSPGGTAHSGHQGFEEYYANNVEQDAHGTSPKYHEAVLDLYFGSGREAWRVLRRGGVFIVKCQDEVCAKRQRLTHIEITNEFERYGFVAEDLFVVVRQEKPGISRILGRQSHARKNHSYFMVYRKPIRPRGGNARPQV
jgi:tRNA G10  N-methylase Trm11